MQIMSGARAAAAYLSSYFVTGKGRKATLQEKGMSRACKNAKVPHYSPHSLRHRRITLWHQSGVPARDLADRAGHSNPSMSLDVYSHVMPTDEVPRETVLSLL